MLTKEAIQKLKQVDQIKEIDSDSTVMAIMEHLLEVNETGVIRNLTQELTQKQEKKLEKIIKRLKKDEPAEYITGLSHFYGHRFKVNQNTLIPRVETEMLVAMTMEMIYENLYGQAKNDISIADVGTGSGCIIISLAMALQEKLDFYAVDLSPQALEIARQNIEAYNLQDEIELIEGNLLKPFEEGTKFDIIVANLPYIPEKDLDSLDKSVQAYEPVEALKGGSSGLKLIEELIDQSKRHITKHGTILLEAQPKLMEGIQKSAKKTYPQAEFKTQVDSFDKKRFAVIQL
jgi:release factor glutamine methyltransferase